MAAQKLGTSRRKPKWKHAPGREPGLDPHRFAVEGELDAHGISCDTVDLSNDRVEVKRGVDARGLSAYMKRERPAWSKCRWINVNGTSWSVLRQLGLRFDLHPLALEDALHTGRGATRSKVDWYKTHAFIKVLMHELDTSDPTELASPPTRPNSPTGSLKSYIGVQSSSTLDLESSRHNKKSLASMDDGGTSLLGGAGYESENGRSPSTEASIGHRQLRKSIEDMTRHYRVRLAVQQLSLFLLRDGTIITVFEHDSSTILAPIFDRLRQEDTILRTSQDSGMLAQAILDAIVDELLEVAEAFRRQLTVLESKVLVAPEMDAVRHLHVLSGDLLMLKRTLSPMHALIATLRHHDSARGQIVASQSGTYPSEDVGGFLSGLTKTYLADVLDHLDGVISSLELFSGLANNLVDYSFQAIAFSQNNSMQGLTIVTTVFLPLTFLSGYFGMNFTDFDEIQGSVSFFWKIAIPTSVGCIIIFGWSYFVAFYRHIMRQYKHWRYLRGLPARRNNGQAVQL